ncbi:hypothetical protein ACFFRR_000041 [Megaselia abdita]
MNFIRWFFLFTTIVSEVLGFMQHPALWNKTEEKVLSRKRRYLSFPEGSSFACSICMTVGVHGNPNYQWLSQGINWGVGYDLPNTNWTLDVYHGVDKGKFFPEPVIKRRNRRELYSKLQVIFDSMGYDGRDCIMRALCESKQFFTRRDKGRKGNMIQEMLKSVFSMPRRRLFTREIRDNSEIVDYDRAFRSGVFEENCATIYPNCGFSLLELALGKYSQPPTNGYVGVM